jgi:hypothetical protein
MNCSSTLLKLAGFLGAIPNGVTCSKTGKVNLEHFRFRRLPFLRLFEGKQAVKMTRLSCYRFRSNQARLTLSLLAYNLGSLWRRLALPKRIENWSLTSLQQRLVKTRTAGEARTVLLALTGGEPF